MAGSVNKVILLGRLGSDPEMKYLQDNTAVCNFSIATDESYKKKDGEQVSKTEWHKIVAWRRLAEICGEYLSKGKQVYLEGKLQTRSWEDRDGNKRYTTEININSMVMLGGKSDRPQGAPQGAQADSGYTPDDDVPF